jgi:hypothetical protein
VIPGPNPVGFPGISDAWARKGLASGSILW